MDTIDSLAMDPIEDNILKSIDQLYEIDII